MKKGLGAEAYKRQVIQKTAIGHSFAQISNEDRERLREKVNTMYHIIKNKDPFTDYPKLLNLQKNKQSSNSTARKTSQKLERYYIWGLHWKGDNELP